MAITISTIRLKILELIPLFLLFFIALNGISVIDFKFVPTKATNIDAVNDAIKDASEGKLKGILSTNEIPHVSVDFNHKPHSSIFDLAETQVIEALFVRVMSWYDNEWGFSNRMIDTAKAMGNLL